MTLRPEGRRLPATDHGLPITDHRDSATDHGSPITDHGDDPSGFAARIIAWQKQHGRRDLPWQNTRDPYRIWLSEIMLQQTQVSAVIPYYLRFLARFPDLASLAEASEDEVLQLWAGLGYYARARNLHRAARTIVQDLSGTFPQEHAAVCALPGIGRSTAAAIRAFAYGARDAILDGNVKRVLARHFGVSGLSRGQARRDGALGALGGPAAGAGDRGLHAGTDGSGCWRVPANGAALRPVPGARDLCGAARESNGRIARAPPRPLLCRSARRPC